MKIEGPWAEAKPELNLMRSSVRRAGVPIFRHILANAPSRGSRAIEINTFVRRCFRIAFASSIFFTLCTYVCDHVKFIIKIT